MVGENKNKQKLKQTKTAKNAPKRTKKKRYGLKYAF